MLLFPLPTPTLPTTSGNLFPVRRVICIGRNYADHAREMGGDPRSEPPFFFMKPADAIFAVPAGEVGRVPYPPLTADYQHELELCVALASGGRDIPASEALAHVWGYAAGLDMTRRDLQAQAKAARRPWEIAKAFDASAPIGPLVPVSMFGRPDAGGLTLSVNGALRQRGDLADMIWSVAELIADLSRWSELAAGDVIMTGTPSGVGAVVRGDRLRGEIRGLPPLEVEVV